MVPTTPIRIALIGLSANAKTAWASAAHLPYLLSPRGQSRYQIVALLNSSKEAAMKARSAYSLPETVKTYGDPASLAADANVDLVVCTTRVDLHYETVVPSVRAGKDVFVEWPLAQNVGRARELLKAANESGSRTLLGLQLRVHPVVRKIKEMLLGGVIGEVLSSQVLATASFAERGKISQGSSYFLEKEVGGNVVTILLGHMTDYISTVLPFTNPTINSQTQIQRPDMQVYDNTQPSKPILRETTSTVPDLVSFHGQISQSPAIKINPTATITVNFRNVPPFPGQPAYTWQIEGSKGEILVKAERPSLGETAEVHVHDFETGKVRKVEWKGLFEDWQRELPDVARGPAKLYDLFFEGNEAVKVWGLAGFEEAVVRHEMLDEILYGKEKDSV